MTGARASSQYSLTSFALTRRSITTRTFTVLMRRLSRATMTSPGCTRWDGFTVCPLRRTFPVRHAWVAWLRDLKMLEQFQDDKATGGQGDKATGGQGDKGTR